MKNIEASTVAEAMFDFFCHIGIPRKMLSDRGSQFTSSLMAEVRERLNIKGVHTTPYHLQCNDLFERFSGTLKKMLRRMAADQSKECPRYVSPLLFSYCEVSQSSLRFSPFEMVYGRSVRGPLQILRDM